MKIIRESISFQRGLDTKRGLNVGLFKKQYPPFDFSREGAYLLISSIMYPLLERPYKCIILIHNDKYFIIYGWDLVKNIYEKKSKFNFNDIKITGKIDSAVDDVKEFENFVDRNRTESIRYLGLYENLESNIEKINMFLQDDN